MVGITLDTYSHVAPAPARQVADLAALILGDGDLDARDVCKCLPSASSADAQPSLDIEVLIRTSGPGRI